MKITLMYIIQLMFKRRKTLVGGQLVCLLAILVSIPIPLMLPMLVDEVLLDQPDFFVSTIDRWLGEGSALYYIMMVAFSVIFLRLIHFLLNAVINKLFTSIAKAVTFDLRSLLLDHLKHVTMKDYESLGSGAVVSHLVTDINTLDEFIMNAGSKLVASVLMLVAIAFVMVAIHPLLGIMILTIQPLVMVFSKRIVRGVGDLKRDENKAIETFQNDSTEVLDLFGQIKASNKEEAFFDRLRLGAQTIRDRSNAYGYRSLLYERFSFTLFLIMFELLRASGLIMVAYSDLSIGMMFAMFGYIWFMITPVQDLLSMQYAYGTSKAAMKRINALFELKKEVTGDKELMKKPMDIVIKDLCFSYDGHSVLDKVSLTIKAGDKIALMGESGSGKTTLAALLAGFYEPNSGTVLYDGIGLESLRKTSLRQSVFLVLQMPILFNDTLRLNVTMGELISDDQIIEALEMAQMGSFFAGLEQGLDTVVGRHGVRLSGGQRQRLCIARMIIADPSVVIFDESTSALDEETEQSLFKTLQPIVKDKTVITIAHRSSVINEVDRVLILEQGRLVCKK